MANSAQNGRDAEGRQYGEYDFIVVSNRLPVDRASDDERREGGWRRSPGGLVTALAPVMAKTEGAWVGWPGAPDETVDPFDHDGMRPGPGAAERRRRRALSTRAFRTPRCGRCITT